MPLVKENKKMKINIILPALGNSGGINVIYKYAELLTKYGHDVAIYKSIISHNMNRYNNIILNKVHQIYCSIKICIEYKKRNKYYDRYVISINDNTIRDADVIIATAWPTAYVINSLNILKGRKYYFIQDFEVWDNKELGIKSYNLPLNKVVISTWINRQLEDNLGIGPFPIIYNGIDGKKFYNNDKKFDRKKNIQCLMLNHHLEKKGVSIGIKVFEEVKKQIPNISIKMFGMCDNSNLPEYINYIQNPTQDELVKLYSESDIFIFPSLEEGWGLTPLEAMACKCAVIGFNTGFALDIGINYENMILVDPGDEKTMISNLIELINDKKLRQKISIEGYKVTKTLNWESSAEKLIKILMK